MSWQDFLGQRDPMLTGMAVNEIRRNRGAMIRLWESAYGMGFCTYRHKVRQACEKVLRGTGQRVTVGLEDFTDWLRDGHDEWLFPIDDDDTYDDAIALLPPMAEEDSTVIMWQRRTNILGVNRIEKGTRYADTCNYAVRKSFLASFSDEDAASIVSHHWIAHGILSRRFRGTGNEQSLGGLLLPKLIGNVSLRSEAPLLEHPSVVVSDAAYSTYYLHTGSISFLVGGKMARHTDTVEYLRGLPLHPLYS